MYTVSSWELTRSWYVYLNGMLVRHRPPGSQLEYNVSARRAGCARAKAYYHGRHES